MDVATGYRGVGFTRGVANTSEYARKRTTCDFQIVQYERHGLRCRVICFEAGSYDVVVCDRLVNYGSTCGAKQRCVRVCGAADFDVRKRNSACSPTGWIINAQIIGTDVTRNIDG